MKWVPFTVHIKISPVNTGKKFEKWRDMQKIANSVYDAIELLSYANIINIASPGGGQQSSTNGMSSLKNGTAVKPQFGETPAQLQISGFYNSANKNLQPHPELKRIHTSDVVSGQNQHSWESNPSSNVNSEVIILKSAIEASIDDALPDLNYKIFRIDYSGVIYGDRGYHFPK
jgi:hypothetical protein